MATSDRAARLDAGDFPGAVAAWQMEFGGREDTLEASRELAEIEERWGDSLFFGGEAGSASHFQSAQRALIPPGISFKSGEENERRMEAFGRLTNKLYAVGPDGKARPVHDGRAHPRFQGLPGRRIVCPTRAPSTCPPEKSRAERRAEVFDARETRVMQETEFAKLYRYGDHWRDHHLGEMWFEAAKALATKYPLEAYHACQWSLHYFDLYNRAWSAHLPASRWDSDGSGEMMEVVDLQNALDTSCQESPPPGWAALLVEGDWQGALRALGSDAPEPDLKPLADLLIHACEAAKAPRDA